MSDYTIGYDGGIAEYRLTRPESRNSLTFEMYQALENLCRDPGDARVIVLTAEGEKAFASGTDISNFKDYFAGLKSFLSKKNISKINIFEIEDLEFRIKFEQFCKNSKIELIFHESPMFLVSRTDYKDMVTTKKPQLANFYSNVRKSFQIFVKDNKPIGDKWSFDEDNRKRVPKGYQSPKSYTFESKYFEEIKKLIDKEIAYVSDNGVYFSVSKL